MQENQYEGNLMIERSQVNGDTYQNLEMVYEEEFNLVDPLRGWTQHSRKIMPSIHSVWDLIGFNKFVFQNVILKEHAEEKNQREGESSHSQRVCLVYYNQYPRYKCAKCLSFFSTSFGVRTYNILLGSDDFHVLIAFSSTPNSQNIKEVCQGIYCPNLGILSVDRCRDLDLVFPEHQKHLYMLGDTLKTALVKRKFDKRNKVTHPNDDFKVYAQQYLNSPYTGTDSIEFKIKLLELDYSKNEANSQLVVRNFEEMLANFLQQESYECVKVSISLPEWRECLRCIARKVQSAIFLTGVSYTELTLLLLRDSVQKNPLSNCKKESCLGIKYSEQKICKKYLTKHAINPTFYPELVTMKSPRISLRMCILVYDKNFRTIKDQKYCKNCILSDDIRKLSRSTFSTSPEKWLLWAQNIYEEAQGMLTKQIAHCQIEKICTRVERLPTTNCAQHIKYLKLPSENMVEFSVKRVTGELWPPTYPIHPNPYDFENRAVLLVRFVAATLLHVSGAWYCAQRFFLLLLMRNAAVWLCMDDPESR